MLRMLVLMALLTSLDMRVYLAVRIYDHTLTAEGFAMTDTVVRVFRSGNSQAVRLPREIAFPTHVRDLIAHRDGDRLILEPAPGGEFPAAFWDCLGQLPDFQRPPQAAQQRDVHFP